MAKNSAEIENLDQKKCMVQGRNSSVDLVLHLAQLRHAAPLCPAQLKFAENFSQAELLREKSHPHPMFSGTFSSNHLGSSENLRFFHGQAKLSEGTTQLLSQDYNYSNLNYMITLEYHVGLHNHYD